MYSVYLHARMLIQHCLLVYHQLLSSLMSVLVPATHRMMRAECNSDDGVTIEVP